MHTDDANQHAGVLKEARYPSLDGLRFLAFLAVFFFHFHLPSSVYPTLAAIQARGWVGIEIFFALSSFLLFNLMCKECQRTGTISIWRFYTRRLLRIYPLMITYTIIVFLIFATISYLTIGWLIAIASFVSNLAIYYPEKAIIPYTVHLWSLSYEFQVYLILPLMFAVYRLVGQTGFLKALLVIMPVCLGGRAAFAMLELPYPSIVGTPLLRPESVFAGLILAMGVTLRFSVLAVSSVCAASAVALVLLPPVSSPVGSVLIFPVAALFAGSLLQLALQSQLFKWVCAWPPAVYLGRISFGLYVFHLVALHLAKDILTWASLPYDYASHVVLGLLVCVALSAVSYELFERRFLELKPRT